MFYWFHILWIFEARFWIEIIELCFFEWNIDIIFFNATKDKGKKIPSWCFKEEDFRQWVLGQIWDESHLELCYF